MSSGNVVPKWISRQTSISVCAIQAYAIVNEFPWILRAMDSLQAVINPIYSGLISEEIRKLAKLGMAGLTFNRPMGKLGTKEEPGKVRVFAMVDYWTQLCLKPLHDGIFAILKVIPQDATFDQDAAVRRIAREVGTGYCASFDLSAATDRLPAQLQSVIIDRIWPGAGAPWLELLTSRAYSIPKKYAGVGASVYYAVGQPMGAYSSWGMLALSHHYLIQLAAFEAGFREWFSKYAVLGDDVVIWDDQVAKSYLKLMEDVGVEISFAKSLVSYNGTWEFAKRFYAQGVDCTPMPLREASAAIRSFDALLQLILRLGGKVKPSMMLGFLGKGYKVKGALMKPLDKLSRSVARVLIFMSRPGVSEVSFGTWAEWIGMKALRVSDPNQPWRVFMRALFGEVQRLPTRVSREHLKRVSPGPVLWESVLYPSFQDRTLKSSQQQLELLLEVLFMPLVRAQTIDLSKSRKLLPPIEVYRNATAEGFDIAFKKVIEYITEASKIEPRQRNFCMNSVDDSLAGSLGWWSKVFDLFHSPPPRKKFVRKPIKLDFGGSSSRRWTGEVLDQNRMESLINKGLRPDLASLVLGG